MSKTKKSNSQSFRYRQFLYQNMVFKNSGDEKFHGDYQRDLSAGNLEIGKNKDDINQHKDDAQAITEANFSECLERYFKDKEFASFAKQYLHQSGILYLLKAAIIKEAAEKGYHIDQNDIQVKVSIKEDQGNLVIDEAVEIMKIQKFDHEYGGLRSVAEAEDSDYLLKAEAKYVVAHDTDNNRWKGQIKDTTFDYKDDKTQEALDDRSITTRIKDWFKGKFNLNQKSQSNTFNPDSKYIFYCPDEAVNLEKMKNSDLKW
ncbi:MAG: hypothetical protein EP298_12395 [Gammaproteobacteria bacterium]|nr:MAG: hypothetical protein EP298_12395 [Gammaproteobacteria bacterium]UTW43095.1 hypothetical protein KFE69_02820 [bacterium SCSIO 12844]